MNFIYSCALTKCFVHLEMSFTGWCNECLEQLLLGHVIEVLNVLAKTEHLRWVASHEVLGYIDYGTENDKDEARLLHGCLKPWESLSTRLQSYDYNVVDVSLGII